MAIDGSTVVVGAYDKNSYRGAAYVFRTSDGGATYVELAKLTASDASTSYDYFGNHVAIAGNTIVIGAYEYDTSGTGKAYVFHTEDGGATYVQVYKLTAADAASYDRFGCSVAIDGDTIVVGSYYDDDAGSNSGSVYAFDERAPTSQPTSSQPTFWPTTSKPTFRPTRLPTPQPTTSQPTANLNYLEVAKLTASDAAWGRLLRRLRGHRRQHHRGRVPTTRTAEEVWPMPFRTLDGGATYVELAKLTASDASTYDYFGVSVAIDGDTIAIGAYADDSDRGAAYVFRATAASRTARWPS